MESFDEIKTRLEKGDGVAEVWQRSYRGWDITFVRRPRANGKKRVSRGHKSRFDEYLWYSQRDDISGTREYEKVMNDDQGRPGVTWRAIESDCRDFIDEHEGGQKGRWGPFRGE